MATEDYVDDFLPLTPAALHVLMALASGPRHGYAIMKHVQETGEGRVTMGPGTLYGTIRRLEGTDFVVESASRPDSEKDDERRRYYELTPLGARVFGAEIARLERVLRKARSAQAAPA